MISLALAWYARRIVNVNINIILAGLLALVPVCVVVHIVELLLARGLLNNEKLGISDKLVIGGATFIADVIFDVAIYYALHFAANHTPWLKARRQQQINAVADAAVQEVPFFRDATKVQIQRAVISPLLYVLWLGTQQFMMNAFHTSAVVATCVGFVVGMAAARSIHTMWMLRHERADRAKFNARLCGRCGYDLKVMPIDAPSRCPDCGLAFQLVRETPAETLVAASQGVSGEAKPPITEPKDSVHSG